jgi:hypothetical protein
LAIGKTAGFLAEYEGQNAKIQFSRGLKMQWCEYVWHLEKQALLAPLAISH